MHEFNIFFAQNRTIITFDTTYSISPFLIMLSDEEQAAFFFCTFFNETRLNVLNN